MKALLSRLFNVSVLEKNRWPWVDYLRGIAIILVVYRHVLIGLERGQMVIPEYLVKANMMFFSFRMPLFFILSGIFIQSSIGKRTIQKLISLKFDTLLYPYLVWAVIQISLQIALSSYTNADRGWKDYLFILYQPRALDQFWYLPALFNTTIIYVFLKAKCKVPTYLQLALGVGLFLLAPLVDEVSMMSDWMEFYIFFAIGDIFSKLFFAPKTQELFRNPWTLLAVTPVFVATQIYYLSRVEVSQPEFLAIALIGCFAMFVLAFRLQSWNVARFLRVVGFHSLYIYVTHVLASAFVRMFLMRIVGIHDPTLLLACGIVAGIILPIVFYNLVAENRYGWFLFSPRKPKSLQDPKPTSSRLAPDQG